MQTYPSGDTTIRHLPPIPPLLIGWLAAFPPYFTAPTWQHVLVLVAGAVLAVFRPPILTHFGVQF